VKLICRSFGKLDSQTQLRFEYFRVSILHNGFKFDRLELTINYKHVMCGGKRIEVKRIGRD
jgi:hypothetical protein